MKKRSLVILLATVLCVCLFSSVATIAYEGSVPTKINKIGKKTRTVTAGSEFKLRIYTNGDDDYVRWKITGKKGVVAFEDYERDGDDIELHAKKKGTTYVTAYILGTKKKITFKVKVKAAKNKKYKIYNMGYTNITLAVGQDKDLAVRKSSKNLSSNNLKWTITGTKGIVAFDDNDVYDDDIEIIGIKTGVTYVTCTNKLTKQKVVYKVTVSGNYYDD